MRSLLFTFFSILLLTSCFSPEASNQKTSKNQYHNVKQEVFMSALDSTKGLLIDVRTPQEYQGGHIEGAVNIDYFASDFKAQLQKLDLNQPVFVYCKVGGRSGKAAQVLLELGAPEVYDLIGGYSQFRR